MAEPLSPQALSYYAQMGIPVPQQQPNVAAYAPQPMPQQAQPQLQPSPGRMQYNALVEQRFNEIANMVGGMDVLVKTGRVEKARKAAMDDVASIYPEPPQVLNIEGTNIAAGGVLRSPVVLPTEEEKLAKKIGIQKSLFDLQEAEQKLELTQKEAQVKDLDRALKLQSSMANSARALNMIDSLLTDPELASGVGWKSTLGVLPETKAKELKTKIDQIKGDVFLKAYEGLRGGGQITQPEGEKATQALARIDPALSVDEFKKALLELRGTYLDFSSRAATGLQGFVPQEQAQPSAPQMAPSPTAPAEPARVSSPGAIQFVRDPQTGRMIRQQ